MPGKRVSPATSSQPFSKVNRVQSCVQSPLNPVGVLCCAGTAADAHPLMAGIRLVLLSNYTGKVPKRESWKTMDLSTGNSQAQTELFLFLHCGVGERKRKLLSLWSPVLLTTVFQHPKQNC